MIIDILVIVVLLISCLIAFLRGFIREVLTIFSTIGALLAAYYAGPMVSPFLRGWLGVQDGEAAPKLFDIVPYTIIADILAYGGVFVVVVVALSLISHIIAEAARKIGLGAIDRTLGVLFGLLRGALLLGLLYLPVHLMVNPETKDRWFEASRTHIYLEVTAEWLGSFLPEDAFEDAGNDEKGARKKLESLDLLNDPQKALEQMRDQAAESGVDVKSLLERQTGPEEMRDEKGYDENFRENMDKLFEDKAGDPNAPKAP